MIDFVSIPESSTAVLPPPQAGAAEARELLADFAATGRQEPFEEIVRRYGAMVFNLCYEVTGNRHDAEDAVQAAFLSLAVQSKSGTPVHAIGPWLQQVARRMSLDINRSRKRRKKREAVHGETWETRLTDARDDAASGAGSHGNPASAAGWVELRAVVQEELATLPPKYRMPLILHYYGGLSRDEMARELNCKANTLGVRLHRGREMLQKRLAKRGVSVSGVILGVLTAEIVHSIVTDRLVHRTAQAAMLLSAGHPYACGVVSPQIVALAQSGARALANAKVKFAAALALLAGGAAAAGAQVVSYTGPWNLPRPSSWDLNRAFRWLFNPPHFNTRPLVNSENPSNPKQPGANDDAHFATVPPPPPGVAPQPIPPRTDYRALIPFGIRGSDPAVAQSPTYPPVPFNPRDASTYPAPPYKTMPPINPGLNPGLATGGSDGGGGGGGSTTDNATPGGTDSSSGGKAPRPQGLANDRAGSNSVSPDDNTTNDPQKTPPGRGGVKPRRTDVANDANPSGGSPSKPQSFDPGEIVNQTPLPSRGNSGGTPPIVGPVTGPTVPPSQPPVVVAPKPPPQDAQDVETAPPPPVVGPGSGIPDPNGGRTGADAVLRISTDYTPDTPAPSFDDLRAQPRGPARFDVATGEAVTSRDVFVGYLGSGVATQSGGVHTADSLSLGTIKTGHGLYELTGGELQITAGSAAPDAAPHAIEIGGAGEGLFLLGNATSTGQISQIGEAGGTVNLTVGAIRAATGTLRGWGIVSLTGRLANNGRVIADGYGQDRSLDLSSFTALGNDFANRTNRGWYAVNHGRLDLPAMAVSPGTSTQTWGGNNDDDHLTLVNSARLTFHDVQSDALVKIALLALDRTDVPAFPTGHHLVGMWSFEQENLLAPGGADLVVRYDDALAASMGLDESVLKLWTYDGEWHRLDHDPTFFRDPLGHTLGVHTDLTGVSFFAVSAPEPAAAALALTSLSLTLLRRRRRS